jgi:hypothetical protein
MRFERIPKSLRRFWSSSVKVWKVESDFEDSE